MVCAGSACTLADGSAGRCRLVATCVGVTIAQIAANECPLVDGQSGVCCADVTTNHVHIISDGGSGTLTPVLSLSAANVVTAVVDAVEAEDILRIGLEDNGTMEETTRTAPRLAARPPLSQDVDDGETDDETEEDDDDQVNFIDDSEPNEFHLRFNMPRASSLAVDASAHALLQTTRRLKEANNLTDLEAGLGLRSQFNSDTSDVIDAHCPWTPEPTCDPNQVRRMKTRVY
jgi:hypothetical protein